MPLRIAKVMFCITSLLIHWSEKIVFNVAQSLSCIFIMCIYVCEIIKVMFCTPCLSCLLIMPGQVGCRFQYLGSVLHVFWMVYTVVEKMTSREFKVESTQWYIVLILLDTLLLNACCSLHCLVHTCLVFSVHAYFIKANESYIFLFANFIKRKRKVFKPFTRTFIFA